MLPELGTPRAQALRIRVTCSEETQFRDLLVLEIDVAREIPAALSGGGTANCRELFFGDRPGQLFHDWHCLFLGFFFSFFHFVMLSLVFA